MTVQRGAADSDCLGVRVAGRNSDNTLCQVATGWAPSVRLEDGLARPYAWIYAQVP